MDKLKVIFHVDEIHKLDLALANVKNFLKGYGGDMEIELLLNYEAVREAVRKSEYREDMEEILDKQARIKVCSNALKFFKVEEKNLIEGIETVQAGVVELALRQKEGYGYIKP